MALVTFNLNSLSLLLLCFPPARILTLTSASLFDNRARLRLNSLLSVSFLLPLSADLDLHYFWKWSAFEDYLLFCFGFTVLCAVVTLLLLDSAVFVETLGSLAVVFEAMLGVPQLLQNFHNRSTKGMRYGALAPRSNAAPQNAHSGAQRHASNDAFKDHQRH